MTPADAHYCRVLIQQSRAFRLRGERGFSAWLLNRAGAARRNSQSPEPRAEAQQLDLFGGVM